MKDRNRSALNRLKTLTFTITLALLFVLFTLPAQAANWVQVDKTADGTHAFVDTQSIQITPEGIIRFWDRLDFEKPVQPGSDGMQTMVALKELDPVEREVKIIYVAGYSGPSMTGRRVASGDPDRPVEPIIPGTVSETIAQFVCEKVGIALGSPAPLPKSSRGKKKSLGINWVIPPG